MVESILYLIQSVSGYVEATEDKYLPEIFAMLTKIPSHYLVSQTALLMIGTFWYFEITCVATIDIATDTLSAFFNNCTFSVLQYLCINSFTLKDINSEYIQ